jgi:hypothetical protein
MITEVSETNNNASVIVTMNGCLPDLTVNGCGSMDVKPTDPVYPGNITVYATIVNSGLASLSGPFDVDFNISGTHYNYIFNGTLNKGASQQISIVVPAPAHGDNQLTVTADANSTVNESSEINNAATGKLCWDFALTNNITCGEGLFLSSDQIKGRPVKLATGLLNTGLYEASHVQTKFEVSGPGITGWLDLGFVTNFADNLCVCPLKIELPGNFVFTDTGHYQVRITTDFNDQYTECNENNQITVDVTVSDPVNLPDYIVRSEFIAPSLLNPDVDQPVRLYISYKNEGSNNTDSLELYAQVDNTPLDSLRTKGLDAGKTNTDSLSRLWSSSIRGVHVIRAIIDNDKEVNEIDELNNEATRAIVVGQAPNLYFSGFAISNQYPTLNSTITINTTIQNQGQAGCFAVYQLFYIDNNQEEVLIRQQPIAVDSAGTINLSTPWLVTDPRTILKGRIINANPVEYDDTDNEAMAEIGKLVLILSSSPSSCPDSANGVAKVAIIGGVAPYFILWDNGMTGDSIGVASDTLTLSVTDSEGVTINDTIIVTVINPTCAPTNQPPNITITTPAQGASYPAGSEISLTASASDPGGSIVKVEFYNNGIKFATDSSAPYEYAGIDVEPGNYVLTAKAFDNSGDSTVSDTVRITVTACTPSGSISAEGYANIPGGNVSDLTSHPSYPNSPAVTAQLGSFEYGPNYGDNYGARVRGYICVPETGYYTFYIAGDDQSGLWLSTDENPANKVLIAYVETWVNFRSWFTYPTQRSAPIRLIKGVRYYIETLHKEAVGPDHLSVAWTLPDGTFEAPIPGSRLSPWASTPGGIKAPGFREAMEAVQGFSVLATPNPSSNHFSLITKTDRKELITITVTDVMGRVVERRQNVAPNSTIQFGNTYRTGVYFVEVGQGNRKEKLKLIRK